MRKFVQSDIDIIYEQLKPDEELLWRGKPQLVPNLAYLTTLFFSFLTTLVFLGLRLVKINHSEISINFYQDWFVFTLLLMSIFIVFVIFIYSRNYYNKIKDIFYVVTDTRLTIFNSSKGKIILSKRYSSVKILRYKKTIFDSGSIIFDIEFNDERIKETGFINIDNAEAVLDIINHQLHHTRNKI